MRCVGEGRRLHTSSPLRPTAIHSLCGITNSSGGLYRGSNMPYKGLKLMPVHISTAAPKSMILTCKSTHVGVRVSRSVRRAERVNKFQTNSLNEKRCVKFFIIIHFGAEREEIQ